MDGITFYERSKHILGECDAGDGHQCDYDGGGSDKSRAKRVNAFYVAVTQAAAERARVAGIRKQIEEIEDISQSRDITENPDGTLLCSHCTMQLETKDEDCACEIIYRKRKGRIDGLRAELNGPGEGKA